MRAGRRRFVYLHELLGRQVMDPKGERVGRIEEIRADRRGDVHEVTAYLLGPGALLERLAIAAGRLEAETIVVGWDQLDINDPAHPRLTCDASDVLGRRRGERR